MAEHHSTPLPAALGGAPLRTVRATDASAAYAYPGPRAGASGGSGASVASGLRLLRRRPAGHGGSPMGARSGRYRGWHRLDDLWGRARGVDGYQCRQGARGDTSGARHGGSRGAQATPVDPTERPSVGGPLRQTGHRWAGRGTNRDALGAGACDDTRADRPRPRAPTATRRRGR